MEERVTGARVGVSTSVLAVAAGLALVIVPVALLPEDRSLGSATRWIFFHGALVWTAIIFAFLTAVSGALNLFSPGLGSGALSGFARRARGRLDRILGLATLLWVLSLGLSFPIMNMTWGGILWREPRLLMSFTVTSAFLLVWAVAFVFERRRLTAALGMVTGLLTVVMVITITSNFHPDSPVFSSGDPRFIGGFLTILAGLLLLESAVALGFRRE